MPGEPLRLSPLRRHHGAEPRRAGCGSAAPRRSRPSRRGQAPGGRCRRAASTTSEDPAKAALRELEEETGIRSVEIIAESPGWYTYDLPVEPAAEGLGRTLSRAEAEVVRRALHGRATTRSRWSRPGHQLEFDAWRWAGIDELVGPDRALQARRLRAGGARLRRPRPATRPSLNLRRQSCSGAVRFGVTNRANH